MNIHVGVLGNDRGWNTLLEQEGVPHSFLHDASDIEQCSVVIVSDTVVRSTFEKVEQYLKNGGAVVCAGQTFTRMTSNPSSRVFVRYLIPEPESVYIGCGIIDLDSDCTLPASANQLRTNDGSSALLLGEFGGGYIAVLPFDAGAMMRDHRIGAKSFYARGRKLPHEQVSLVAKGAIRKLISRTLELLHHRRGLPYVHAWYYPRDAQSIFALRIDTDFANEQDIDRLHSLAQHLQVPFSWFVHVKHQQKFLQLFKAMVNHEIGIHCFNHVRYDQEETALHDIHKAINVFHTYGMEPRSFSAPYGCWNNDGARAIDTFRFDYSSEFSYDYDNLPSYPLLDEHAGSTLQVPIHPISIGSLRRQGFNEEEMHSYFNEIIDSKMSEREPLIFYHHPKNHHEVVLENMIKHIQHQHVPSMRMIDCAKWWKERSRVSLDVKLQGAVLNVSSEHLHNDVWIHITQGNGTESFVQQSPRFNLEHLVWKAKPISVPLPDDIHRARTFNPWIYINHVEDYIHRMFFPRT